MCSKAIDLSVSLNDDFSVRPLGRVAVGAPLAKGARHMKWHTPRLVEVCVGLEINDYLPAEL